MTASTATARRASTRKAGNSTNTEPTSTTQAAKPMNFSQPTKGFFPSSRDGTSIKNSAKDQKDFPAQLSTSSDNDGSNLAKSPSQVGPMRRKVSEPLSSRNLSTSSSSNNTINNGNGPTSTTARPIPGAGSGGNRTRSPSTSFGGRNGTASSRSFGSFASRGGDDSGDLSTSFGAAAEALSLSSSNPTGASAPTTGGRSYPSSTSNPLLSSSLRDSSNGKTNGNSKSMGHSHFGQECYGPGSGDLTNPPVSSMLSSSAAQASPATTTKESKEDSKSHGSSGIHKCESCSKVYRHPSCLVKHRWEHTVYWKEASKFLMSKHQQVQLLEAAAILVGMDAGTGSLPEEKALWPAAISPPASGLLGSDKIDFEKLKSMAQKQPRQVTEREREDRAFSPLSSRGTERSPSVATDTNNSFEDDEEREIRDYDNDVEIDEDSEEENEDGDADTSYQTRSSSRSINYNSSNSRGASGTNSNGALPRSLNLSPLNRMSDLRIATSPTNKSHLSSMNRRPNHRQHYQSYSSSTIPTISSNNNNNSSNARRSNANSNASGNQKSSSTRNSSGRRTGSELESNSEESSSNTTGTDLTDSPPDTTQFEEEELSKEKEREMESDRERREKEERSGGDVLAEMDMD